MRPPAADREDGAVLMIVAVILVVLFALLVLTVDLGLMVANKRVMVTAADSSALAAAISCGSKEGETAASAQAAAYAASNGGGEIVPGFPQYLPSCDAPAGMVKIEVRYRQELFFAPVLGLGSEGLVVARATAFWGGAGIGEHLAPLMVNANRLGDCEIPPPPGMEPEICTFWWDNSPASASDPALANAEWGTLDPTRWDVAANAQCANSTPPEFERWMFEGFFSPLPINYPDRTYVCRGQGNFGASLDKLLDRAATEEILLYFPVNRPEGQVDKDGKPCAPGTAGCSPDKYDIIGFARMTIIEVWKGNTQEAYDLCIARITGAEKDANARCMVARWEGFSHDGLDPGGGSNFGIVPVRLIE